MGKPDQETRPDLRVGIVGCGLIALNHVEGFKAATGAVVVACSDVDPQRARAFAERHAIGHAVSSLQEMVALGVQVVAVCTPHPAHEAVVLEAASLGLHVLCEKPIAVDTVAARRMVAACQASGVQLGVMFQRRFWPASQRIRQAVDNAVLGTPILGQCTVMLHREPEYYKADTWRGRWDTDGGGVLMTQAIHYLDLLRWFMGPVAAVTGHYDTYVHGDHIEVEDSAAALLRFRSGAMATVLATTGATPSQGVQIKITGSTGATVSVSEYPEGTQGVNDLWDVPGQVEHAPVFGHGIDPDIDLAQINRKQIPFHALQVADFVSAIRQERDPLVTGVEALASLELVEAIYRSQRSGRTIEL